MTSPADMFSASLRATLSACAELAGQSAAARSLADEALIEAQRAIATAKRNLDASASVLAGEIVARSGVDAGLSGLARREGFRTPEALIQSATGTTARDATTLVRAGTMINDAAVLEIAENAGPDAAPVTLAESWLAKVGQAIATGRISISGAESLRSGLGQPSPGVDVEALARVASGLLESADTMNPDQLYRLARDARDVLDAEGIANREHARVAQRSFRRWRKPDGMTRYVWELDPESAAFVDDIYDAITSPRRGGPRFVDEAEKQRADAILNDSRSTDQLASDGMLAMLKIAVDAAGVDGTADTSATRVIGSARPAVRVLVTATDLEKRTGSGRIEAQADPISIETVERFVCDSGIQPIVFDENLQAIDVGREQRLFTNRQRRALAARDGGCMWPGCDRPPAWTEAHHVRHWKRDRGKTDLSNGILLCRHHHMLLHDSHWEIELRDSEHWLIPPAGTTQMPQRMPSKSAALRDLQRVRSRAKQAS